MKGVNRENMDSLPIIWRKSNQIQENKSNAPPFGIFVTNHNAISAITQAICSKTEKRMSLQEIKSALHLNQRTGIKLILHRHFTRVIDNGIEYWTTKNTSEQDQLGFNQFLTRDTVYSSFEDWDGQSTQISNSKLTQL